MFAILILFGCRKEDYIFIPEEVETGRVELTSVAGLYLLNEGNMGSNKSTLDRYDFSTGVYTRNIYAAVNPDVPMELGDVGNDLAIYGGKLYAVINCSNKVEIMDVKSCRKITQINIPNCRHIAFWDGYAYVTSYAGPVEISPDYKQRGFVAKIDTATLQEVGRCTVGYQPDGIAVSDRKIYVANSGGYMAPNYQRTVSVIDADILSVIEEIDIAPNLNLIIADKRGRLWISSRGNYRNIPPSLTCYDTRKRRVEKVFDIAIGSMCICGDSIYTVGGKVEVETPQSERQFAIFDTERLVKVSNNFISDKSEQSMRMPYGVSVNPATREIFVTDAWNYVNPGYLHCYSPKGKKLWSVRTGDIPSCICFYQ